MFLDISSTILWRCNLKSPQNGNLKTRIIHIDRFIYLLCLKCVLIKATCEREIIKLFQVTKYKGFYSFKLEKNTKRKVLKLNTFYLVEKIVRFHVVQTANQDRLFTARFTNMRILKFKSQPTIAFFAAVNHLNGSQETQLYFTGSKGHGL